MLIQCVWLCMFSVHLGENLQCQKSDTFENLTFLYHNRKLLIHIKAPSTCSCVFSYVSLCLFLVLNNQLVACFQISKYRGIHLLKMLRCAQKPRHSYLKGCFITFWFPFVVYILHYSNEIISFIVYS